MPSYAYLAISPNTAHDKTWFASEQNQVFQCIKIGHTATATSGRINDYNTYNPSIFTRMLSFANPVPVEEKNVDLRSRSEELGVKLENLGKTASSALYLQRYCLEGSYDRGGSAKEWFILPNQAEKVVALIMKLEEDSDSETEPRAFKDEREFCLLFMNIMQK